MSIYLFVGLILALWLYISGNVQDWSDADIPEKFFITVQLGATVIGWLPIILAILYIEKKDYLSKLFQKEAEEV